MSKMGAMYKLCKKAKNTLSNTFWKVRKFPKDLSNNGRNIVFNFTLIISLTFLCANGSSAQNNTTATIQAVTKDGLHKMIVPSEIRSYSRDDLSDFRIFNAENREVPYFLVANTPTKVIEQFEDFPIISKVITNRKSTAIEVENKKLQIKDLQFVIVNSEVTKKYSVSGSNDQKEWFGLVNNGTLSDLNSDETTEVLKDISFPLCSYRYLKIVFDDTSTLPINVLKVGHAKTNFLKGNLQHIKGQLVETMQVLAEKKTLMKVVFDYPQYIDKVVFGMNTTSLFKRQVRIYTNKERVEKHKTVLYQEDMAHFSLVSNQSNAFEIANTKQKTLFIEIDNQDNPPLEVSSIKFYQKPIFAVADLKTNIQYSVTTGNPNLQPPQYDLAYFKETISNDIPETNIISIEHQLQDTATDLKASFWQQPWFMWLCISIGGLTILFFSMKLIKEM